MNDNSDLEDPFETDDDEEYIPSEGESEENENNQLQSYDNNSEDATHITPKKTRKKQKRESDWQRNIRKKSRTLGKEYVGSNKKLQVAKTLQVFEHKCRYKCNEISEDNRNSIFEHFYKIPTYDLQNAFISSCITKNAVLRKKVGAKNKQFSTKIVLLNKRVCKQFFLKTLSISNKRFTTVCHKTNEVGICQLDKRGKGPSGNKIDSNRRNSVINHIKMFPRFCSHYSRRDNPSVKYLSPELNIIKMFKLYEEYAVINNIRPVKLSFYRHVFNTEFNLRFHKPYSDTCSKCDKFQNIIQHSENEEAVTLAKVSLTVHQKKAQKAIDCKNADIEKYKDSDNTIVICFDLQQTLPTPLLTTSKVFYLRQLWTYNFCIHNLVTGIANMYIWDETTALRGSQDIGSCLIKFISSLPPNIKNIIAYSDSCAGQNKNKNITKLFMFLVKCTNIKTIEHKFLEPGHTYMECDRDFGIIEKNKRKMPQIFVPEHWMELIKKSCKKFDVHKMEQTDFLSFAILNEKIKDPKKATDGKPLKFRDIVVFKYSAEFEGFSFAFKYNIDPGIDFLHCVCCQAIGRPSLGLQSTFSPLHRQPLGINVLKWNNLQTLMEYVPPIHHTFYGNIKCDKKDNKKSQKNKPLQPESDSDASDAILESDYE